MVKSRVVMMSIVIVMLSALCATSTAKANEPKLPIKHGLYVPEGIECPKPGEMPASSISCSYNGEGLSIPRCRCKTTQVSNNGNIYYLVQRCLCKGEDILTIKLTIIINSITSFSILNDDEEQKITKKKEILYRYCSNPNNL